MGVHEGGDASFTVRLSERPTHDVAVSVRRTAGDEDITVASPGAQWSTVSGASAGSTVRPIALATNAAGTLAVLDGQRQRIDVRDASGHWRWIGEPGAGLGRFGGSASVALDNAGGIYVADAARQCIQVCRTNGQWASFPSGVPDPAHIAVDNAGLLYVAGASSVQMRDSSDRWVVVDVGAPAFNPQPLGIAFDGSGCFYVLDRTRGLLRRDALGVWQEFGYPSVDPEATVSAMTADEAGNVYVAWVVGSRYEFTCHAWNASTGWKARTYSSSALFAALAPDGVGGLYVADGWTRFDVENLRLGDGHCSLVSLADDALGSFHYPSDITIASDGAVSVTDRANSRVQRRDANGVWTAWGSYGPNDGELSYPDGIACGSNGTTYVADFNNRRVQARAAEGTCTAWPLNGSHEYPVDVAVGPDGSIVASSHSSGLRWRDAGTWRTTDLGRTFGSLAFDVDGALYATCGYDLLRRDPMGNWITVNPPSGKVVYGTGLAVGRCGDLYIADRTSIWKRDPQGQWATISGDYDGKIILHGATGVAEGPDGTLWCTDTVTDSVLVYSPGLLFTPDNWDQPQSVTLAAAEDPDAIDGVATIRCEAEDWTGAAVTATEIDNDLSQIVATPTRLTVPEGEHRAFALCLSRQPVTDVTVHTGRLAGDSSLQLMSGVDLTFTTSNWQEAQAVTIGAQQDVDMAKGHLPRLGRRLVVSRHGRR
ncbi:MAG: NHL repeat-containing protein [Armatimonadetes bacterium]|nr:NHL repeat-containing protein [Armatimonadota bacterium]